MSPSLHGEIDKTIEEIATSNLQAHFVSCVISPRVNRYVEAVIAYQAKTKRKFTPRNLDSSQGCLASERECLLEGLLMKLNFKEMHESQIWLTNSDAWQSADAYFKFLKYEKDSQASEERIADDIAQKILCTLKLDYPQLILADKLSTTTEMKSVETSDSTVKLFQTFTPNKDLLDKQPVLASAEIKKIILVNKVKLSEQMISLDGNSNTQDENMCKKEDNCNLINHLY